MSRSKQDQKFDFHVDSSRPAWLALLCALALTGLAACGDDGGGGGDNGTTPDSGVDSGMPDGMNMPDSDASTDSGTPDSGPPENFQVRGFGLLPARPASCQNPDKTQRLRFYFQNDQLKPLRPGDYINGREVQPGQIINAGSLDTERMRVATSKRCTSPNQCSGNMKCGSSGLPTAQRYCLQQSGVTIQPGTVQADYNPGRTESDKQLIGIMIENTGSWSGNLPQPVAGQYNSEGEHALGSEPGRASDPDRHYRESLETFSNFIPAATDPKNTKIGGWYFAGEARANARPMVGTDPGDTDHFTNNLSAPQNWFNTTLPQPNVISPANIYQSLLAVMEDFSIDKYSDYEKFLIVIVDGPNEVKDDAATYQDVLQKAQSLGIHISIMHLDAPTDTSLLRDLPSYYRGDAVCRNNNCGYPAPCTSDSECLNFETCRTATVYADEQGGTVSQTDDRYCMPEYDENGQLGRIGQYADLACKTNGHYFYFTDGEQYTWYPRILPFSFNGQWSVEAEVSALSNPEFDDNFYSLSGVVSGLVGSAGVVNLTAKGFNFTSPPVDTRLTVQRGTASDESN